MTVRYRSQINMVKVTAVTLMVHHETIWHDSAKKQLTRFEANLCYKIAIFFNSFSCIFTIDIPKYVMDMKNYYDQHQSSKFFSNTYSQTPK